MLHILSLQMENWGSFLPLKLGKNWRWMGFQYVEMMKVILVLEIIMNGGPQSWKHLAYLNKSEWSCVPEHSKCVHNSCKVT